MKNFVTEIWIGPVGERVLGGRKPQAANDVEELRCWLLVDLIKKPTLPVLLITREVAEISQPQMDTDGRG